MPDHFGHHGFTRHAQIRDVETINLEELVSRLPAFEAKGHAKRTPSGVEVNLSAAGIDKLLGRGRVTGVLTITVGAASDQALAKVQEAGGQVLLPSPKE